MSERGTTNGNARGSAEDRRRRRAWIVEAWASDVEGFVRCYRCGDLLYNPDSPPPWLGVPLYPTDPEPTIYGVHPLTIDRILPGCKGGTYRRNNIRPACGKCNSETGGALAHRKVVA